MQIAQSDEKAFHALYQHHFAKVYAMSLHYMPDVFRAQDMVQEVFGRVWQHRNELPGIRHLNFNSFEDLELITGETACVVAETIQAEAGVVVPVNNWLKALQKRYWRF